MASETLSVSAIVFCVCLPINRKNKRQFNFLPLVKYFYFIFRITPTIDIEPKFYQAKKASPQGEALITLFLTPTIDKEPESKKMPTLLDGHFDVGISLFFQAVTSQVFSAPLSLTSVFGMGTGGPSASSTPTI